MSENLQTSLESPAYEQMQQKLGAEGMAMLDGQLDTWAELNQRELASPLRDSLMQGNLTLPEGTLLHGMGMYGFNAEALQGVAEKGIVSGELIGISEDSETHGCADFFRVPAETSIAEYFASSREPVITGNLHTQKGERLLTRGIAFIVDPEAEGMKNLIGHDGYRDSSMASFVRPPSGRSAEDTAAILGGVPKGAIAGIVASAKLLEKPEIAEIVRQHFPDLPVFDHEGVPHLAYAA